LRFCRSPRWATSCSDGRRLQREKKIWLIAASCVFYAYWSAAFLALLFMSIVVNFFVGRRLQSMARERGSLVARIADHRLFWNLSLLGYFKYANFFIDNFDAAFGCISRSRGSYCRWAYRSLPFRRSRSSSTAIGTRSNPIPSSTLHCS
jgi:D-alanyl-lipoteichoic acid acyltransferase DltB (MBOAT superfamily)